MTNEQKQVTLGQVGEMKVEVENSIKNLIKAFMDKTGVRQLSLNGCFVKDQYIDNYNTIKERDEANVYLDFSINW